MSKSAAWCLLQKIAPKIRTKIRTPVWKIRAGLRTKTPRPNPHTKIRTQIRSQNPQETKDTVRVSLQEYLFAGSSKVSSCGFWQKRVRLSDLLEGGLTVLQEPTLTVPFESKLLPAVLLFLRIYFPKITATVTVLKFG